MFGTSPTTTGSGHSAGEIAAAAGGLGAGVLAMAAAAGGAVVSGVNDAVHAVTGVDVIHPDPVSGETRFYRRNPDTGSD